MSVEGVDYAFPPRPDIAGLAAAGKVFACRYGGPGTLDKQLDPQEARDLSAAGIAIVANAEGAANGLTGGRTAGVSWATKAEAHFAACGMPAGRPVYFSVDFDVVATAWPNVREALKGAADVLGGVGRVGVYGGRDAILWARRDGVASWFWQTYAWSGGFWVPGNHIEQYRNGVEVAGAKLDLDRALQSDYGQWMTGDQDMSVKFVRVVETQAIYATTGTHYFHLKGVGYPAAQALWGFTPQDVVDITEAELVNGFGADASAVGPGGGVSEAQVNEIIRKALKDFGQSAANGV